MFKRYACFFSLLAILGAGAVLFASQGLASKRLSLQTRKPHSVEKPANDSAGRVQATPSPPIAPFGKHTEVIGGVPFELLRAPTGAFIMGDDHSPNPEEKPAHQVNVRSFYLGRYEVTRTQWNVVVETLPKVKIELYPQSIGRPTGMTCIAEAPADYVAIAYAVEFCERLARATGKRYRLPSEAEWEYACRAGTTTAYSFGDTFDPQLARLGLPLSDLQTCSLPVGSLGYFNAWGFYDMHGNAIEWVQDASHPNYLGAPTDGSAWMEGGKEDYFIQRGGLNTWRPVNGRSASRHSLSNNWRGGSFGLRIAADIPQPASSGNVTATSAASYLGGRLAVESIAALFGDNLSPTTQTATSFPLPRSLAGTSVTIKDSRGHEHLAPLFFSSPRQINFQLPAGLPSGPALVSAVRSDGSYLTGSFEVVPVSPGLFTVDASGRGLATGVVLRIKPTGEQIYEPIVRYDQATNRHVALPIDLSNATNEVFLLLFGTGFRQRRELINVTATIGGVRTEVPFAGAQGELAGLDQCNIRLPQALAGRGEVEVALMVEGKAANSVKLVIK